MLHHMIRVELHGANSADYRNLEQMLRAIGVTDEVQTTVGYGKLPSGEYHILSGSSTQAVHDAVKAVADRTRRSNAVVVSSTTADKIFISGLAPIDRSGDLGR